MHFPEIIDHIILSFLGINHRKRCNAVTKSKTVCRLNTTKHRLLCTLHHKKLNDKIKNQPFSTIIETYQMIFNQKRFFQKPKFDIYGYYSNNCCFKSCPKKQRTH